MKCFVRLGFVIFLGLPVCVSADAVQTQAPTLTNKQEAKQDTPEERAYKAEMIKMDDAIAKKIAQIQAKQKEIDTEVYLASKPPLIADRAILEGQLRELQMARDKMQTEESARKMAQDLKKDNAKSP